MASLSDLLAETATFVCSTQWRDIDQRMLKVSNIDEWQNKTSDSIRNHRGHQAFLDALKPALMAAEQQVQQLKDEHQEQRLKLFKNICRRLYTYFDEFEQ